MEAVRHSSCTFPFSFFLHKNEDRVRNHVGRVRQSARLSMKRKRRAHGIPSKGRGDDTTLTIRAETID